MSQPAKLKVLTLNCFGVPIFAPFTSKRLRLIADEIIRLDPDVVCLQEIFLPWHKRLIKKKLAKHYPDYFLPVNGLLRTGGGLAIFSKLPLAEKKYLPFSRSGYWTDLTWSDKIARKGLIEIKFDLPSPWRLFNVHLTSNYHESFDPRDLQAQLQRIQLDELAKSVNETAGTYPCLVAGDLNITPDSYLIKDFLIDGKLEDLTVTCECTKRSINIYNLHRLFKNVIHIRKEDYILGRNLARQNSRWQYVINDSQRPLSDHFGIMAEIEI